MKPETTASEGKFVGNIFIAILKIRLLKTAMFQRKVIAVERVSLSTEHHISPQLITYR